MQTQMQQVIVKMGSTKLQYKVPLNWSINKLKCLLSSQVPSLNFDQFQLCYNQKLLRGNHKIKEVRNTGHIQKQIEVQIVKAKSQIKFSQYYKNSVGKFMEISSYNKQPILSVDYQKYRTLAASADNKQGQNQNNLANINDIPQNLDDANGGNNGQAHPLFRALRLVGTYLILVLIYDHGKAHQIAIIASIILLYFGIQMFVKYKQKKIQNKRNNNRNNNQNAVNQQQNINTNQEQAKPQQNKTKGIMKLYYYKSIELIFCFFMTFFPNLSIQTYLQLNKQRIQKARTQINQYLPNSYPKQLVENQNR